MSIAEQYERVSAEVAAACHEAGRDPHEVTLAAVSKTVEIAAIAQAIQAGAHDLAENRPDRIMAAHTAYPRVRWHFIGNIQSRRIGDIVPCASLMHSVFEEHHLPRIDAAAQAAGKVQDILLEVNVSGEESKGGVAPERAPELLAAAAAYPHIRVCGLMTMAPQGDLRIAEECFSDLRRLRDSLSNARPRGTAPLSELSMGMSEDWRCAIRQGATIVRIGRAIFSEEFA
ncbi:YggS family pyridoxal phosphate-dependent enzyme [Curtanaerobium respiraculi]|uniref:YggS family pyridoxal phosphate-dependent enzyme n=1 Tax=Curtanaerobium respiraculi TaxID=2949669 RepID=UPI0024B3C4DC|nr:YggS family pyridoxal phosphate-dependent enzyme [Curtanaerobium respiraculi]